MGAYVYAVIVDKLPSALANDYIPVSQCDMVAEPIPEPPHLRLLQQPIGSPVNISDPGLAPSELSTQLSIGRLSRLVQKEPQTALGTIIAIADIKASGRFWQSGKPVESLKWRRFADGQQGGRLLTVGFLSPRLTKRTFALGRRIVTCGPMRTSAGQPSLPRSIFQPAFGGSVQHCPAGEGRHCGLN